MKSSESNPHQTLEEAQRSHIDRFLETAVDEGLIKSPLREIMAICLRARRDIANLNLSGQADLSVAQNFLTEQADSLDAYFSDQLNKRPDLATPEVHANWQRLQELSEFTQIYQTTNSQVTSAGQPNSVTVLVLPVVSPSTSKELVSSGKKNSRRHIIPADKKPLVASAPAFTPEQLSTYQSELGSICQNTFSQIISDRANLNGLDAAVSSQLRFDPFLKLAQRNTTLAQQLMDEKTLRDVAVQQLHQVCPSSSIGACKSFYAYVCANFRNKPHSAWQLYLSELSNNQPG